MKVVEPIPGLKIYFEDVKGVYQINEHGAIKCTKPFHEKMTREEAIKIMDSSPSFSGVAWIARFEALGLIKFEEEKIKLSPSSIIADWFEHNFINGQYMISADKIVNALMHAGYKIVDKQS